jgi:hypothetical protein
MKLGEAIVGAPLFHLTFSFTLLVISLILAVISWRFSAWVEQWWWKLVLPPERLSRSLLIGGLAFSFFGALALLPSYRFGVWEVYEGYFSPVFGWGAILSAQAFLCLMVGGKWRKAEQRVDLPKKEVMTSGLIFVLLLVLLGWVAWSKTGIDAIAQPWYPIGVPLLPGQVWLTGLLLAISMMGVLSFRRAQFVKRFFLFAQNWNADLLIGLAIWLLTALLWISAPLPRSFFFPGPYPPDSVIYPYADSAIWDMGGQFALIGQGFANSNPYQDHVGWMGVLAFLNLVAGGDYHLVSVIQAGLLAIFPSLMYWLGKSVFNRPAGLFVGGLTIFHEMGAFAASNMIDLSHARFLLTEYPTRVGLAALTLMLFYWFRSPRSGAAYALPIGGLLAVLILIRFNILIFPLAVMGGVALVYGAQWKSGLRASLIVFTALIIAISPWMWRSWALSGNPFFFAEKAQKIFKEKFRFNPSSSILRTSFLRPGVEIVQVDSDVALFPVKYQPSKLETPAPRVIEDVGVVQVIFSRFVRNLVASTLILPTNLYFDDIQHTIYEIHPYWDKGDNPWDGSMTPMELTLLVINLAFISVGLGVSWQRWRLAGLVPLGVCLVYAFSLAVARTSGGRYIVPMDWGILFYWGSGIVQAVLWGMTRLGMNILDSSFSPNPAVFTYKKGLLFFLPFFFFVGVLTITDRVIPERYTELTKLEVYEVLKDSGVLDQLEIPKKDLAAFIRTKGAAAYLGRGLYPRYYGLGQGESSGGVDAYEPENYPRLAFTLIGPFDRKDVVLPLVIQNPSKLRNSQFSNASDVIVVGCPRSLREKKEKSAYRNVIDALFIVVLGDSPAIYIRNPFPPLECPILEPLCEDNFTCQQPP